MGYAPTRRRQKKPPVDGISPTRRRSQCTSSHMPRWWDVPPLGGGKKTLMMGYPSLRGGSNIRPSISPGDGIFPTRRQKYDSFTDEMYPHSEDRICTLLDGMCLHLKALTQTYWRVFLGSPTGAETLYYGMCCHSESPTLRRNFPLSEPISVFCWWDMPPLGIQTLAYELHHLNLRAD